jgi:hypothetical protein
LHRRIVGQSTEECHPSTGSSDENQIKKKNTVDHRQDVELIENLIEVRSEL